MNIATKAAITALTASVTPALHAALVAKAGVTTKTELVRDVAEELAPVIVNQANAEPWYRSNVTMGILLTAAATIAKPWAPDLVPFLQDPDTADAIVTLIQGAGLLWSFAGRWWIAKPLGA